MRTVNNKEELRANIDLLQRYLSDKTEPFYYFALNLIKKGTCFVVVKVKGNYCFYPSRFVGYYNNHMDAHLNNTKKDGRETNPAISNILGGNPEVDVMLDKHYREYCETLGFIPNDKGSFGVERKYWSVVEW